MIHASLFVTTKYWKQAKGLYLRKWLSLPAYFHIAEHYATVKKNKEDPCELRRSDFQAMWLSEKKKNKIFCITFIKERKGYKNMHLYLLI